MEKKNIIDIAFSILFEDQFKEYPLKAKLDTVKTLTRKHGKTFDFICYQEEAINAFNNRNFKVGAKASIKAAFEIVKGGIIR